MSLTSQTTRLRIAAPFTLHTIPTDPVPSASLLLATKDGSVSLPVTRAKWRNPTRRVADMALIDEALLVVVVVVVVVELWGEE